MSKAISFTKKNADLLIIIFVGFFVRWRLLLRDEFWFDEAFTGILMRVSVEDFLHELSRDATPSLYYLLSKVWTQIFGVSDFTLRALSLVLGILIVYFSYMVAKELFEKNTATVSAILIAINPFLIGYSVEARAYSLYGLTTLFSFYLLIKRKFLFFGLSLVIMLFSHYGNYMYAGILVLFYFWIIWKDKLVWKKSLLYLMPAIIVGYWLMQRAFSIKGNINMGWIRPVSLFNIPRSLVAYLYGVQTKLPGKDAINDLSVFGLNEMHMGIFFVILFIIGGVMCFLKIRKENSQLEKFILLFGLIFIPQLALIFLGYFTDYKIYVERYLFPSAIFFTILSAYIITKLMSFEVMAIGLFMYILTLTQIQAPTYYKGMKQLVGMYGRIENEIVFTSPSDYVVGRYYFGENAKNLRLQNVQNPKETYWYWPLVRKESVTDTLEGAIIVSPDESRMREDFQKINEVGNYSVYTTSL